MGAAGQQPADLNLLRGMFTQQAAGALGDGQMGQLSQMSQLTPDVLQKQREQQQRIDNAVPEGFVLSSLLNPDNLGAMVGQALPNDVGYTNPQTGEQIFIGIRGDTVGDITRRKAAPEGYQPQEMPSSGRQGLDAARQGLRAKGMSPEMLMVTSPTGQQMPVSRRDPRLQGLSDDQIRAKLADPRAYQQAPTIGS